MAEALGAIGIAASIIQLVDFGTRVLRRLEDYRSTAAELPEAFRHIKVELPVLLDALCQTKDKIDAGLLPDKSKLALDPAVKGCRVQVEALDEVVEKLLPKSSDSRTRRGLKAFRSIRYDEKLNRIMTVVRGYVQTLTFHAAISSGASAAISTPPTVIPTSNVPFRRDPDFVDRQILADIHSKSQQAASRIALCGIGGVGKSQLAVEHSYRIREKSPHTWVFWVHGGNMARFMQGFESIAKMAHISGWDKPNADVLMLVRDWLSEEINGCWLMIIDNADDLSVFSPQAGKRDSREDRSRNDKSAALCEYIPQSQHGSVLITSRDRETAFVLTGSYADIIKVDPMDEPLALALLTKKMGGGFEHDDAVALVDALDYMPLAISQAAAFICQRAPRATVKRYLDRIRTGDEQRKKLLVQDIHDSRRDGAASNSIMATWQISFEYIRKVRPSATKLLSLMSLFDRQGIPEYVLNEYHQRKCDTNSDLEEDINMLMSFSLVETNVVGDQFEMHRLVQLSTKHWLEINHELEQWKVTYIALMFDVYPAGEYENWPVCRTLFPHAQALLSYRPKDMWSLQAWALTLYNAACYANNMGHYDVAAHVIQNTLKACAVSLGADNLCTLMSMSGLAYAMRGQGKYNESENMYRRILEKQERILGEDHPHTLSSMNNLTTALLKQGKYNEAEQMWRQILEKEKRTLGEEHPDTLSRMTNLATALLDQRKYNEGEHMSREVLEKQKRTLGEEHPHTLISMNNLVTALLDQQKYNEAEHMCREVLEKQKRTLGEKHPSTLGSMTNLVTALLDQGKYSEAEHMCREVLEKQKRTLGEEHPHTLTSMSKLANALWKQGEHDEAERMYKETLTRTEIVSGRDHPDTLRIVWNLAIVLCHQQQYSAAFDFYQRASSGFERVLGPQHPTTVYCVEYVSVLKQEMEKNE